MSVITKVWVLGLFLAFFSSAVRCQDDGIRVDTDLVSIPVTVSDRNGRYLNDLTRKSFAVFENGIEQKIEIFQPVDSEVSVILLIDVSGSMIFDTKELVNAAGAFVASLHSKDNIMVATFSDRVIDVRDFAKVEDFRKREPMRIRIDGIPPITMVYDAVEFALKKIRKAPGRKAIILLSDGIGDGISSSSKSNYRLAEEGEALVYSIRFDTNIQQRSKYESESKYKKRLEAAAFAVTYMRNIAEKSGGRAFQIETTDDLKSTFENVVAELTRQYTLGYYPKNSAKDGERRSIRVEVSVPNAVVRARKEVVFKRSK